MKNKLQKYFHVLFPKKPVLLQDSPLKKLARLSYYGACLFLGVMITAGILALSMLLLAQALMAFYMTAPAVIGPISTVMMGIIEWGSLASGLVGALLLGPLLFNKTAWLFKLVPPEISYNIVDVFRDMRDVALHAKRSIVSFFKKPTSDIQVQLTVEKTVVYNLNADDLKEKTAPQLTSARDKATQEDKENTTHNIVSVQTQQTTTLKLSR